MKIVLSRDEVKKCVGQYAETLLPGFTATIADGGALDYIYELTVEMTVPDVPEPPVQPSDYINGHSGSVRTLVGEGRPTGAEAIRG